MNKYKIVGIVNLIAGVIQIIFSLLFLLSTLPKLASIYSNINKEGPSYPAAYLMFGLIILLGIASLVAGFKLMRGYENREKYLKFGLALIIIAVSLSGFLVSVAVVSIIMPLYSLTSEF